MMGLEAHVFFLVTLFFLQFVKVTTKTNAKLSSKGITSVYSM